MTITVDDDFYQEYQSKKDKIGNISAICRKIIKWEMEAIEDKDTKFLEKVRAQKQLFQNEEYSLGKIDGYREGKQFDYSDYQAILNWNNNSRPDSDWVSLEDFHQDYQHNFEEFWTHESNYKPQDEAVYLTGWIDGFLKFWNEVNSQL